MTATDTRDPDARLDGRLRENVLHFARALRRAGVPIGPGAVLEALRALEAVGLARRDDVRAALSATLLTSREQALLFDRLFAIFWRRRHLLRTRPTRSTSPAAPDVASALAGEARLDEALFGDRREASGDGAESNLQAAVASDQETFARKDFARMSAAEIVRARRLVAGLRFDFDARPSRRRRRDPRGRELDPNATFRRSLRTGSHAIELVRRAPRLRQPPIVALCDISGSMDAYSRIILHFLQCLTLRRRSTRSFLFGTRLTDVTRAMRARDPDEALDLATREALDWSGGTRIATSLRAFEKSWGRRVLGQDAVVLLFTDGLERDPGPDLAAAMRRLHARCHRLIWLNPLLRFDKFEPKAQGVQAMLPHVDAFRPIHDLASMRDLASALAKDRFALAK